MKLIDNQLDHPACVTGIILFVLPPRGFDDQRAEQQRDAEHDAARRDAGANTVVEPEAAELGSEQRANTMRRTDGNPSGLLRGMTKQPPRPRGTPKIGEALSTACQKLTGLSSAVARSAMASVTSAFSVKPGT